MLDVWNLKSGLYCKKKCKWKVDQCLNFFFENPNKTSKEIKSRHREKQLNSQTCKKNTIKNVCLSFSFFIFSFFSDQLLNFPAYKICHLSKLNNNKHRSLKQPLFYEEEEAAAKKKQPLFYEEEEAAAAKKKKQQQMTVCGPNFSFGKLHRFHPCPNFAEGLAAVLPKFAELHREFAEPTPSTLILFVENPIYSLWCWK